MISIEILKAKQTGGGVWLSGIEGEGEYLSFYDNGNLREHSNWKNGKKHGECKWYDEDGNIYEHSFWKIGLRHGIDKRYGSGDIINIHSICENSKFIKKTYVK